ncbi:MAG TPA: Fur family transcriptional regulator [Polyangiales bacterium]
MGQAVQLTEEAIAALHDTLQSYITKKGFRSTSQRRLVTDVFFRAGGHLSIEDLLARVRQQDPRVGYATVYRTLRLLAECELANVRHFGDGVTRYELADEGDHHHDHLICTVCKQIIEFEDDAIELLQGRIAERHGFKLKSHKHELYGVCPECQQKPS